MIGFNFEGFIFVVVDVVPENTLDRLSEILSEPKFRAFSWSCAGDLMVLGVLEGGPTTQIGLQSEILDFKSNQNIWLNILQDEAGNLSLRDLTVCEYKY